MKGDTSEILLELVRAGLFDRTPELKCPDAVNWDDLMDLASEQGVLAWAYEGIIRLPDALQPDRKQRISWALSTQELNKQYERQCQVLQQMISICNQHNVRLLLLKGIGLSDVYRIPSSRPSGDLDCYFFNDFDWANDIFSDSIISSDDKHTQFQFNGVSIENHRTFLDLDSCRRKCVERYLENHASAACVSSMGYYVLPPMPNLVYLIMHALLHLRYAGHLELTFRSIIDIPMYMTRFRDELPPSVCFSVVDELGIAMGFELMIYLGEWMTKMDFREYHRGLVPQKDLDKAHRVFIRREYIDEIPAGASYLNQVILSLRQVRQNRWKLKYESFSCNKRIRNFFKSQIELVKSHFYVS